MGKIKTTREARLRRHRRVRKKISGTTARPRLAVFRSSEHIYAQVIDDTVGRTLATASTLDPEVRDQREGKTKVAEAQVVGGVVARRAREHGVTQVVFDRGGFMYHGRVKALADAARAEGLEF